MKRRSYSVKVPNGRKGRAFGTIKAGKGKRVAGAALARLRRGKR